MQGDAGSDDVSDPVTPPQDRAAPSKPALTIMSPDGADLGTIVLEGAPLRVGREADNDIVLGPDPAQVVSREHCVIEPIGRRWWVRDLNSRNHTFVERRGDRAQVDRTELLHGDTICLQAESGAGVIPGERRWQLAFTDPGETLLAHAGKRLQYFPASETVWVLGGLQLPRRVEAPPKARRMLLFLLARHRELGEPADGVVATYAELKALLWPEDKDSRRRPDSAVANVAWELRPALGDDEQQLLKTETGVGYRLIPQP